MWYGRVFIVNKRKWLLITRQQNLDDYTTLLQDVSLYYCYHNQAREWIICLKLRVAYHLLIRTQKGPRRTYKKVLLYNKFHVFMTSCEYNIYLFSISRTYKHDRHFPYWNQLSIDNIYLYNPPPYTHNCHINSYHLSLHFSTLNWLLFYRKLIFFYM